ncbi:MAG: quinol dehydrogenase ferredoxin subunit NapH [Betaproteobacteria bacterium]
MNSVVLPGSAVGMKGWWHAHRFLLLRRFSQAAIIGLFLLGPLAELWIIKGNLSGSLVLDVLPLTDPFVLAQVLASRHLPETSALIGAGVVIAFYALAGGRVFCAWVCPVNAVTDLAAWLRRTFKFTGGRTLDASLRNWLAAAVLAASAIAGLAIWEFVNPVSMTQRALIFGGSVAWGVTAAVFLFDLFIAPRGWCGHVCPVGATYALIGAKSVLRVSARHASRCNDCADCYAVCPEPQVIVAPLKGKDGSGPVILDSACTNCGRCIDVCGPDVFGFTHRFDKRKD